MRRFQLGLMAGAALAFTLALTLAGCGGGRDDDDAPRRKKGGPAGVPVAAKKTLKPVKGSYDGVISGKVAFKGDRPTPAKLNFTKDPEECAKGGEYESFDQSFWIGDNGNLGNVFVWIEPEEGSYFEVPEAQVKPFATSKVVVSQPHCAFLPHCAVLFPSYYKDGKQVKTGQQFVVLNDAKVSHNANVKSVTLGQQGGTLPPGSKDENIQVVPEEEAITYVCNIHPWMTGYMRAFDHPYAALTKVGENAEKKLYQDKKDPAFGTYEIKGVPVGAKVTLKVWHEKLGMLETRQITLAKDNKLDFDAPKK